MAENWGGDSAVQISEEVGEVSQPPHVEEHDVGGLLVRGGGNGGSGILDSVQAEPPGGVSQL